LVSSVGPDFTNDGGNKTPAHAGDTDPSLFPFIVKR